MDVESTKGSPGTGVEQQKGQQWPFSVWMPKTGALRGRTSDDLKAGKVFVCGDSP